jgi:hypothetical protein
MKCVEVEEERKSRFVLFALDNSIIFLVDYRRINVKISVRTYNNEPEETFILT